MSIFFLLFLKFGANMRLLHDLLSRRNIFVHDLYISEKQHKKQCLFHVFICLLLLGAGRSCGASCGIHLPKDLKLTCKDGTDLVPKYTCPVTIKMSCKGGKDPMAGTCKNDLGESVPQCCAGGKNCKDATKPTEQITCKSKEPLSGEISWGFCLSFVAQIFKI